MPKSKFGNPVDASNRSFRDDPNEAELTERAVTDQITHDKLDDVISNLGGGAIQTVHENGTVGVSNIQVPTVAAGKIHSVLIKNEESNPEAAIIGVSFDGGTTYFDILINENFTIDIASKPTQIDLIGSEAGLAYQIVMNTE